MNQGHEAGATKRHGSTKATGIKRGLGGFALTDPHDPPNPRSIQTSVPQRLLFFRESCMTLTMNRPLKKLFIVHHSSFIVPDRLSHLADVGSLSPSNLQRKNRYG
jgi:hypothetical protein